MTEVVWVYGPSGAGKTKYILNEAKKHDDNTKHGDDPANIADDKAKWDVVPTKIEMNEVLSIDLNPNDNYTKGNGGDK